jgi:hypothetical protein
MSSDAHSVSRSVYVTVLSKTRNRRSRGESDEEGKKAAEGKKAEEGKHGDSATAPNRASRKRSPWSSRSTWTHRPAHPVAAHPRKELPGHAGRKVRVLFLAEGPTVITEDDFPNLRQTLHKFDLSKRKADKFLDEGTRRDFLRTAVSSSIARRHMDDRRTDEPPAGDPKPASGR